MVHVRPVPMTRIPRRLTLWLAAIAIVAAAVVTGIVRSRQERAPLGARVVGGLRYADSLTRVGRAAPVPAPDAVAALYVERARLGVGSPFRLIDQALRDPALPREVRRQVAYAILGRTAEGLAYTSPAEALDLLSAKGRGLGLAHRNFIEDVVDGARDPRAAELALRLAYQVTAASGATSPRAGAVAIAAIAQARDRALARRDAEALILWARRRRVDPVDEVPAWREARRFAVEQPLVEPATEAQEREASGMLPRLITALDSIVVPAPRTRREHDLDAAMATAASLAAGARQAPPQAPVVVTMGGFATFITSGGLTPASRAARSEFTARARNEELLVAEYARLKSREPYAAEAALGVVTAAVALRPYAQEAPWFPGDVGPSVATLSERYGLAAVEFDRDVPASWHPYYTRMFDAVVHDLVRAFPHLTLAGLRVRFGESPLRERALALHDPMTRTVYFPVATSAGAMAHELSHDLDWQAARKRYGAQNSYRTDRSMRQYRDGLAATLDRMAAGASNGRRAGRASPGGERPTEAFARGVDWIVASWLAREGILNGYLSAVQDEWLTGYASASAPRRDAPQADPTITALREIADVSPEMVSWFDASYGTDRRVSVAEGVRRALLSPMPRVELRTGAPGSAFTAWSETVRALRAAPEAASGWSCQLMVPTLGRSDRELLRRTMEVAAEARVSGLVRRWGEYSERTSGSWRFRALGGAPWRPAIADSVTREMRDALLWRAARVEDGRPGSDFAERAERAASASACARGN